jgi:ubiquinone biosynthesis protein
MLDPSVLASSFRQLSPEQLRAAVASLLPPATPRAQRIATIEGILGSAADQSFRDAMARWIVDELVPVEHLVPAEYIKWRGPVRDAMMFVVSRLSPSRLAPKLLEQLELPRKTSAEKRLLLLIAKVPGLQKLGQVIARNRHLRPALRKALARLENGIRDVDPQDIRDLIQRDLETQVQRHDVKIQRSLLSEASVSAVIRFTWRNPETGVRERGVFKVLKPYIRDYFKEDMEYLHGLATYFGSRHHQDGFPPDLIPDTFRKVRRLLQHEVNFAREQKTIVEAGTLYRGVPGVRVPEVIRPLCNARITALTEEQGIKVTNASSRLSLSERQKLGEQLVEALIAVPLLSPAENAIFHGDPHAGNLLYHHPSRKLTIIDWALRESLSREQRRHLALLFFLLSLRDRIGTCDEVLALSEIPIRAGSPRARAVRDTVTAFIAELPLQCIPSGSEVMRLLERVAMKGVKFPSPLIMLSKVMVTLDGILNDLGCSESSMGFTIARHVALQWVRNRERFRSPLITRDWISLQCSALLYASRVWLSLEEKMLERWLPASSAAIPAPV